MLIRRRKKEDADDIVTRVGDYNNAAALNYEPRDIGPVPPDYGVLFVVFSLMLLWLPDGVLGFYFVRRLSEVSHQ